MKTLTTRAVLLFAAAIATAPLLGTAAHAQNTIVSNISESVSTFTTFTDTTFLAQQFTTGATTLSLSSATLQLGNGKSATPTAQVSLYTSTAGSPGTAITVIGTPVAVTSSSNYTFTAGSPIALAANTAYWLVLRSSTPSSDGVWTGTANASSSDFGAMFGANARSVNTGGSYTPGVLLAGQNFSTNLQNAVAVPEAGAGYLAAFALPALAFVVRRRK